ncbi:MAG TPA: hypothetical protein VN155_15865 [Devosia sp.]|nr:hypothetical protein [Devosia sp.]
MSCFTTAFAAGELPINKADLAGCWTKDPTAAELEDWSKRRVVLPDGSEALVYGTSSSTGKPLLEMVPSDHICIERDLHFSAVSFAGDEGLGTDGDYRLEGRKALFVVENIDGWFFARERVFCEVDIEGDEMKWIACVGADDPSNPNQRAQEVFDDVTFTRDVKND